MPGLRPTHHSGWNLAGALGFGLACLLLVWAFDGEYLLSQRVGVLDWPKELFYFHYLQGSLVEYGRLPVDFFTIPESLTQFSTLRDLSYWSNPEVVSLSPFLPLIFLAPVAVFIKLYIAGHFLLAVAGTGLLAKRLGFAPPEGVALLLALNPWFTQHLAIGYSPYVNALLFPGLAALLLAPPRSPLQLALASLLDAMIFYQGSLHLFVWFNLAALLAASLACARAGSPRPLLRLLWVQAGTFVLIFPKYWATSQAYKDFIRQPGSGYASLKDLLGGSTDGESPCSISGLLQPLRGGLLRRLPACGQVVSRTGRGGDGRVVPRPNRLTDDPATRPGLSRLDHGHLSGVFLWLGWGGNWAWLTGMVPLLASEIYPFRWLYVAYMFAAVLTLGGLRQACSLLPGPWGRAVLSGPTAAHGIRFLPAQRLLRAGQHPGRGHFCRIRPPRIPDPPGVRLLRPDPFALGGDARKPGDHPRAQWATRSGCHGSNPGGCASSSS